RVLAFAHQPSARRVYQPAAPLRNGPSPASAADSRREQAVARERILVQLGHKAAEAVDPLPQIGRGRIGPHVEAPRAPANPRAPPITRARGAGPRRSRNQGPRRGTRLATRRPAPPASACPLSG